MKVEKTTETYTFNDTEYDSKVTLHVDFKANTFDILRSRVESGSLIVEKAQEMGIELLKKHNDGDNNRSDQ